MSQQGHDIEFLYFEGCPNAVSMQASLEEAVQETGYEYTAVDLKTRPEIDRLRAYGSPTILVDGDDLFGKPSPASAGMSCRVYTQGLPDSEAIRSKLREKLK